LRYFLDLNEGEIAESLGWPLGTVKTRLHRGRAHLRNKLEADGGGLWTTQAMEGD
jgi:RNA polymerase sigma-70 factor (ECF subfamily)